jgi:NAD(P)-dependent dehydrogenase (short-subunit alcohol dehydrogenase family)
LAVEWAPCGIRVNTLVPGPFPHDDFPQKLKSNFGGARAARIPAGRVGQVHELGWAATYLCSRFASFVTGMTFVIDGGYWLRRGLALPEFVSVREQLGKGPFQPISKG